MKRELKNEENENEECFHTEYTLEQKVEAE